MRSWFRPWVGLALITILVLPMTDADARGVGFTLSIGAHPSPSQTRRNALDDTTPGADNGKSSPSVWGWVLGGIALAVGGVLIANGARHREAQQAKAPPPPPPPPPPAPPPPPPPAENPGTITMPLPPTQLGYGAPPPAPVAVAPPEPQAPHAPPPETPKCTVRTLDGSFEAVQGPYQDDPVYTDKPARYERLTNLKDGSPAYVANLDMVVGRFSALTGVHHYFDLDKQSFVLLSSRDEITLTAESNCRRLTATKWVFTLTEGGNQRTIYTKEAKALPVLGPPETDGVFRKFTVTLPAAEYGLPYERINNVGFKFKAAGRYLIDAAIDTAAGVPTGIHMTMSGAAVETHPLYLRYLPVKVGEEYTGLLELEAEELRLQAEMGFAALYPVQYWPKGDARPVLDLREYSPLSFTFGTQKGKLLSILSEKIGMQTLLEGASRLIVLLTYHDFNEIVGTEEAGYTMNTKVIFVKEFTGVGTVEHEVAHTLPEELWSDSAMLRDCNISDHNAHSGHYAFGLQMLKDGRLVRLPWETGLSGIMEAGDGPWIEQCTYWNILKALQGNVDPPVSAVSGRIWRTPGGAIAGAEFGDGYDVDGSVDKIPFGPLTFIERNADGKVVHAIGYAPTFGDVDAPARNDISFVFRLPRVPDGGTLELVAGKRVLARKHYAAHPPALTLAPVHLAPGRKSLHLIWSTDRAAVTSVQWRQDWQPVWVTHAFERADATSDDVPVPAGHGKLHLRVIAAHDGRSISREIATRY